MDPLLQGLPGCKPVPGPGVAAAARAEPLALSGASSDGGIPTCRYCLAGAGSFLDEAGGTEELIAPCNCAGSVKWVHPTCLQQWLTARPLTGRAQDPNRCDLCQGEFRVAFRLAPGTRRRLARACLRLALAQAVLVALAALDLGLLARADVNGASVLPILAASGALFPLLGVLLCRCCLFEGVETRFRNALQDLRRRSLPAPELQVYLMIGALVVLDALVVATAGLPAPVDLGLLLEGLRRGCYGLGILTWLGVMGYARHRFDDPPRWLRENVSWEVGLSAMMVCGLIFPLLIMLCFIRYLDLKVVRGEPTPEVDEYVTAAGGLCLLVGALLAHKDVVKTSKSTSIVMLSGP